MGVVLLAVLSGGKDDTPGAPASRSVTYRPRSRRRELGDGRGLRPGEHVVDSPAPAVRRLDRSQPPSPEVLAGDWRVRNLDVDAGERTDRARHVRRSGTRARVVKVAVALVRGDDARVSQRGDRDSRRRVSSVECGKVRDVHGCILLYGDVG